MNLKPLLWKLFKASVPVIIIPGGLIWFVFVCFGLTTDSLLAIIMLTQVYIVAAQVEVALRQSKLSSLKYEPQFKVKTEDPYNSTSYQLKLINEGQYLARNIAIQIIVSQKDASDNHITAGSLSSGKELSLVTVDKKKFNSSKISIGVSYSNIIGRLRRVKLIKNPDFDSFIVVDNQIDSPGFLFNAVEDLGFVIRSLHLMWKTRKFRIEKEQD